MAVRSMMEHWMELRGLSFTRLATRTGIDARGLRNIARGRVSRIELDVVSRICRELGIGIGDLLVFENDDIWSPIVGDRKVTIHHGTRTLPSLDPNTIPGLYVGDWDARAEHHLSDYLYQRCQDVEIKYSPHMSGNDQRAQTDLYRDARDILEVGNHIVIGSPVANVVSEYLMCSTHEVPAGEESSFTKFPYGFVWQPDRWARSALGRPGNKKFGVWCNHTQAMVAEHKFVTSGESPDCGIITVQRSIARVRVGSQFELHERVVIVLMGHSGPGTLAAAKIATNQSVAAGLFPSAVGKPFSRAFRVTCSQPTAADYDNRVIKHYELVPLPNTLVQFA